jgi:histidine triad (HIT) family protein
MTGACLFCRIAKGEIPSFTVFEDDQVLAFLDISPLAKGHTLVIPKRHAAKVEDLTTEEAAALFKAIHRIAKPVCEAVDARDSTIAFNNGPAAGQEVPHVHCHIVPRRPGDTFGPIHRLFEKPTVSKDELAQLHQRIKARVR